MLQTFRFQHQSKLVQTSALNFILSHQLDRADGLLCIFLAINPQLPQTRTTPHNQLYINLLQHKTNPKEGNNKK